MGSLDAYHGTHPLRKRAKKLFTEGILIVRFELPFNCWCTWCSSSISLGVRYNAAKKQIGTYLSSPVWEFKMPCHLCHGELIIHTDPENDTYVCIRGLQKKVQDYEITGQEGVGHLDLIKTSFDKSHREQMMVNPLYALEFATRSRARAEEDVARLASWESMQQARGDPILLARQIRSTVREAKQRALLNTMLLDQQIASTGFALPLTKCTEEDELEIRNAPFQLPRSTVSPQAFLGSFTFRGLSESSPSQASQSLQASQLSQVPQESWPLQKPLEIQMRSTTERSCPASSFNAKDVLRDTYAFLDQVQSPTSVAWNEARSSGKAGGIGDVESITIVDDDQKAENSGNSGNSGNTDNTVKGNNTMNISTKPSGLSLCRSTSTHTEELNHTITQPCHNLLSDMNTNLTSSSFPSLIRKDSQLSRT